jgi:hypothetical protein
LRLAVYGEAKGSGMKRGRRIVKDCEDGHVIACRAVHQALVVTQSCKCLPVNLTEAVIGSVSLGLARDVCHEPPSVLIASDAWKAQFSQTLWQTTTSAFRSHT